jgi:hypothetical protein
MGKYKIEIEIDVNFQKYFDEIPEGLYKEKEGTNTDYEIQVIDKALRNAVLHSLQIHLNFLKQPESYPFAKHHLLIEDEVCKQLNQNAKITKIE